MAVAVALPDDRPVVAVGGGHLAVADQFRNPWVALLGALVAGVEEPDAGVRGHRVAQERPNP
ncbi:hypothetical protein JOF41_001246 [Saccharothrix coeruleofusca]|uniref:hypothetical protein n=1 Tax=Saccharothrix coeruleofusca TaxID=33919 RepID=UPI001AE7FC39|nr:hypothetical protein [Saccharothrix coeruleofusca]MBP2335068.1 hypothetical protein [Saccharothrix coeruleofusca]